MTRRATLVWLSLATGLPGCFPTSQGTTMVPPSSPFAGTTLASSGFKQDQLAPSAPPATQEAAVNVARVGLKVASANPALGMRPQFVTVGGDTASPEIFHRGDYEVVITETMARQCKTEGELAAVLSQELGKMVAERAAANLANVTDHGPPVDAPSIGNDRGGAFGPADGTRMMELAKYERKRALAREQATPPDPTVLARTYLEKAGYNPADLEMVAPLLRTADGNNRLEKLMDVPAPK